MNRKALARAMAAYTAGYAKTQRRTDDFLSTITRLIDEAGINYLTITARAKTPASFADKVARRIEAHPGESFDPLLAVTDQIGVRIVTYVQSDIAPVAQLLAEHYTVLEDRDMGRETAEEGRFGYSSRHMLLSRTPGATSYDPAKCVSVQLRTVLQHAWAEFEHDARYKGSVPPAHAPELDRRFTLAAGLLELADREFSVIRETLTSGAAQQEFTPHGERIDPRDLAAFLAGWYEDSGFARSEQYVWAAEVLTELGVTTIEQLREALQDVDSEQVSRAMGYRVPPGAVRRLEDDLLARDREAYLGLAANADRVETLRRRAQRLGGAAAG